MVRWLEPEHVGTWVTEELFDPDRQKPVVALTTFQGSDRMWLDAAELEKAIGDGADLVAFRTGDATWELADALPTQLEVYGGAVRIWWPGLQPDSNPFDHRLYLIRSPREARTAFASLVQSVCGQHEPGGEQIDLPATTGTVRGIGRNHVEIEADGREGELRFTDVPIAALARCLEIGARLSVRPARRLEGNRWAFSTRGLLPDPWKLAAESLRDGDVVPVKISQILENGVVVEVLPRVQGFVYWTYVDWDIQQHEVADSVRIGDVVPAKISEFDRDLRSLKLSIKDAHPTLNGPPRELPSLVPGGLPFTWPEPATPGSPPEGGGAPDQDPLIDELRSKLEAADADRKDLRDKNRELKKQLRAATDKLADLERRVAHEIDPLSSDRAFLVAVRVTYAKTFDEGTREQHPLHKMRVGGAFLDSVRTLDGVELEKILEVCAQVASGIAHEVDGREVHPLRAGVGGAKAVVRASDKATAWRCALQVKTPSARRLHWWAIPGPEGQIVEFAKVGVHDDLSMPE